MSPARIPRTGQPILVYAGLLVCWVVVRAVFWETPLVERVPFEYSAAERAEQLPQQAARNRAERTSDFALEQNRQSRSFADERSPLASPPPLPDRRAPDPIAPFAYHSDFDDAGESGFAEKRGAAGHQLMWLAAMARLPVPRQVAQIADQHTRAAEASPWLPLAKTRNSRWSLDAWVFLREGSGDSPSGVGPRPSYGKSQQGAVIRYRLADADGHEPSLFGRVSYAPGSADETDLAVGFSAKPFARLPAKAHVEMRMTRSGGQAEIRPVAFATTGVHRSLAHDVELRGYGQAGYAGGDYASAFVDGQLVADRQVAAFDLGQVGEGKVRLGAGAWGGAQKGAERLDVGPSANVDVLVADTPARLSVDYRIRILGEAAPDSGMALTLSTGF